ncbi:MAG: Putative DNA-binding protein in cluster with Type I restriction-modification system [uncultured Campylobacterales bacterium]|uniref:DNA-binding protein in cluster with Type I restriction-modification system n=1 Tax=uncultured Campylobacterales bacterium TaxID=352960 RepID=A0A6S6SXT8_9BACT|nr:MAG: Putative DNA-binding protein in cluster with Type I restriction-modification system [uncultured Campylobacterales bacterium]
MNNIIIYENGNVELKTTVQDESVWLSQKQMESLFGRERSVITKHINNVFKEGELEKSTVCANFAHTAKDKKTYDVKHYNLDVIISVGYRVKSKQGTKFRQWATTILKDHLIKGYTLNKQKLASKKLDELNQTINFIKQSIQNKELNTKESKGFIEIISNYAKSWALLQGYDEGSLIDVLKQDKKKFILDYDEAKLAIKEFKTILIQKNEATELFGNEKADELKGHLRSIYQTFGGIDLLPSLELKAANLLYYVIKGHPFNDGNKRIGAYLFILFLSKNKYLYKQNGELKINDNALTTISLLVASSDPSQKEIIIKLITNILYEE